MAIYAPLSQIVRSREVPLQAAVTLADEGIALVGGFVGDVWGAKPSTGSGTEVFLGFAIAQTSAAPFLPTSVARVQEAIVPAGGAITLAQTPTASTTSVYDVTAGAAVAGGDLAVSGAVATITANGGVGATGNKVIITYRYALTVAEAKSRYGDVQPGGYVGNQMNTCGLVQSGIIYTNAFNTARQWRAATGVKLAANGLLDDNNGSGTAINANVVSLPTVDYPFLGVEFNAI